MYEVENKIKSCPSVCPSFRLSIISGNIDSDLVLNFRDGIALHLLVPTFFSFLF